MIRLTGKTVTRGVWGRVLPYLVDTSVSVDVETGQTNWGVQVFVLRIIDILLLWIRSFVTGRKQSSICLSVPVLRIFRVYPYLYQWNHFVYLGCEHAHHLLKLFKGLHTFVPKTSFTFVNLETQTDSSMDTDVSMCYHHLSENLLIKSFLSLVNSVHNFNFSVFTCLNLNVPRVYFLYHCLGPFTGIHLQMF